MWLSSCCGGNTGQKIRDQQKEKRWAREKEPPVRPLPTVRPRALTELPCHPQGQSSLISRLPQELRIIIWTKVLGRRDNDDVLHLDLADGVVKYQRCSELTFSEQFGFRHHCWSTSPWTAVERKSFEEAVRQQFSQEPDWPQLTSLLLTCKLIYRESVDLLYNQNIFDIRRSETILRLPQLLLPQRLQNLRHLRFSTAFQCPVRNELWRSTLLSAKYYTPPDDGSNWPAACHTVALLPNLQSAHFIIALWPPYSGNAVDPESLTYVLGPLREIHATEFVVILTENVPDSVLERLGPLPYQLKRRTRPGIGFTSHPDDA